MLYNICIIVIFKIKFVIKYFLKKNFGLSDFMWSFYEVYRKNSNIYKTF